MVTDRETLVKDTVQENDCLREVVQEEVTTKDERENFTVLMKERVCKLLDCNVPTGNIPVVMCPQNGG